MTKREKLLRNREYVIAQMQLNLLNLIGNYKDSKNLKDYQLAEELGVSKGYVSQVLNATYDHKLSKIADLALACNAMPLLNFVDLDRFINEDADGKYFEIYPTIRPERVVFSTQQYTNSYLDILSAPNKILPLSIAEKIN